MKLNNKILEAVNRGIKLALDDYEDSEIKDLKSGQIEDKLCTKEIIYFYNSFVDLGLPSRTLWAKYNLGCDWDKLNKDPKNTNPKDWYGNYYAWGETLPKNVYQYENYKFKTNDGNFDCTKYNCDKFSKYHDELRILQFEDDAAYNDPKYPGKFRMPTYENLLELKKYTDKEYIKNYLGIKNLWGLEFTSKINGNKIFLPAAGMYEGIKHTADECGMYWTSSCLTQWYQRVAFREFFNSAGDFTNVKDLQSSKVDGLSIRPILNR